MKTVLAALVAGLLGGGAVVGAVAAGVVPLENLGARETRVKTAPAADHAAAAVEEENARLRDKVNSQAKELSDLSGALKQTRNDLDAITRRLEAAATKEEVAKIASTVPAAPANAAGNADGAQPAPAPAVAMPSSPEYRAAWRAEQEAYEKERQEQRRLNLQAERVKQLEEQKTLVAKTIPETLTSQAARLNLNETQVKACSDALVVHAHKRLEIMSAMAERRINDEEIDAEALQAQLADLDAATRATLLGSVDEKTADSLLQMTNRAGRGGSDGGRGGRNTRPGGRGN